MREIGLQRAGGLRLVVAGPLRSVKRSGRDVVRELLDGSPNTAPDCCAVVIAGSGELIRADRAFVERFVAAALEHQVGGAPDIDLGYHADKIASLRSINV
jgi:hypothetical protein